MQSLCDVFVVYEVFTMCLSEMCFVCGVYYL